MRMLLSYCGKIIVWFACLAVVGNSMQLAFAQSPSLATVGLDDNSHSIAVVIGNKSYQHGIVSAEYAHNDADAMKSWLINGMGFKESNIILEKDAPLGTFFRIFGVPGGAAGDLLKRVKVNPTSSNVFIYYSGHGVPE